MAGQLQEQAVAHGDVGYDHLPAPGLAQEALIDQQRRNQRLGVGKRQVVAFAQLLGAVSLAAADQLVEVARVDEVQVGGCGRLADFPGGKPRIAAHGHERTDILQRQGGAGRGNDFRDVVAEQICRPLRGLFAGRQRFLQTDRS